MKVLQRFSKKKNEENYQSNEGCYYLGRFIVIESMEVVNMSFRLDIWADGTQ